MGNDEAAFTVLYLSHSRVIYTYLSYSLLAQDLADDLTQETFLAAWRHGLLESVPEPAQRTWLLHTATNLARNAKRKRRSNRQVTYLGDPLQPFAAQLTDPTDVGEQVAAWNLVCEVIQCVSPQYRKCLLLHDLLGYSVEDIADIQNVQPKTVQQYLRRGRDQFGREYQRLQAVIDLPRKVFVREVSQ